MIMRLIAMINPVVHSEKDTIYLQNCALKWTVVKFGALYIEYSRIWMSLPLYRL